MGTVARKYSKRQVDKAGAALVSGKDSDFPGGVDSALEVVNNWRSCHNYPLNTFKVTLRTRARQMDKKCIIAQRIKRRTSIEEKLRLKPTMNLSQMQDIGGCRAVMSSITGVNRLLRIYMSTPLSHELNSVDDYILHPKTSGYRGTHLVYKTKYKTLKSAAYNSQYIEIQIRSKLQHLWATAVETVGTLRSEALKSSIGEEDWLRFFQLMGSVFALKEKSPLVPGTPTTEEGLRKELLDLEEKIDTKICLRMYNDAIKITEERTHFAGVKYFLLTLHPKDAKMSVSGFRSNELALASHLYSKTEESIKNKEIDGNVVFVAVDSFKSLRKAFPNYFMDTKEFLEEYLNFIQARGHYIKSKKVLKKSLAIKK